MSVRAASVALLVPSRPTLATDVSKQECDDGQVHADMKYMHQQ